MLWPMGKQAKRRGHLEERLNGRYRAVAYAGIDPLTRKKRHLKKTVDTPQQAEIELTKLLSQIDERRHPRSAVTAGEVVDMWLDVATLQSRLAVGTYSSSTPPSNRRSAIDPSPSLMSSCSNASMPGSNAATNSAAAPVDAATRASHWAAAPSAKSISSSAHHSTARCDGNTSA
jgi:hypothetical protein